MGCVSSSKRMPEGPMRSPSGTILGDEAIPDEFEKLPEAASWQVGELQYEQTIPRYEYEAPPQISPRRPVELDPYIVLEPGACAPIEPASPLLAGPWLGPQTPDGTPPSSPFAAGRSQFYQALSTFGGRSPAAPVPTATAQQRPFSPTCYDTNETEASSVVRKTAELRSRASGKEQFHLSIQARAYSRDTEYSGLSHQSWQQGPGGALRPLTLLEKHQLDQHRRPMRATATTEEVWNPEPRRCRGDPCC